MIQVKNSTQYYINERALTFSENDLDDPNRVAVSLVSGTVILVHVPGTIDYASDGNYERWTLKGYSTLLVNPAVHYIYARLSRTDRTALIVFSVKNYNVDGSITTVNEADGTSTTTEPSADYYYIKIGELTATDSATNPTIDRELTYDSGLLSTAKGNSMTEASNMWELLPGTNPLIKALHWLTDFTVKGYVKLIGGLKFSKGQEGDEKTVSDIKRSTDSDNEYLLDEDGSIRLDEQGNPVKDPLYVPVSDETIPTTQYVQDKLEGFDDKFLRKDQDDRTAHSLSVGGKTTAEGGIQIGSEFASGLTGYGANIDEKGQAELHSLFVRTFLEVPELRYNRITVRMGDEINSVSAGVVERVEPAADGSGTGTLWLKLEDGEFGSLEVDDLVMQIFSDMQNPENNAEENSDDGIGNRTIKGFATVYFEVVSVSGDRNEKIEYKLREDAKQIHPYAMGPFSQRGNRSNTERQTIIYQGIHPKPYTRYMTGVDKWEFTFGMIGMQLGDLSNMSAFGQNLSGYSAYLNNVYYTGFIFELTPQQKAEISAYSVSLSEYVGSVRVDSEGNVIAGEYTPVNVVTGGENVVTGEENVVTDEYLLQTHVQAFRGETELVYTSGIPESGQFTCAVSANGCTAGIANGVISITSVENFEYCSVRVETLCEGKVTFYSTYQVKVIKDGTSALYADIDNEMDSVACDENGKVLFGLPVSCNVSAWYGQRELEITAVELSVPEGVTAVAEQDEGGSYTGKVEVPSITDEAADTIQIGITVYAELLGKTESRSLTFTVNKVRQGESAVLYKLLPSVDSVKVNDAGEPDVESVSCRVLRVNAIGAEELTGLEDTGLAMQYRTGNGDFIGYEYGETVDITEDMQSVSFRLYLDDVLVDAETVSVVKDGNAIKQVGEFYLATPYGYGEGVTREDGEWGTWVEGSIPELSEEKRYLWNYEVISYTGTEPTYTEPAIIAMWTKDGKGVKDVYEWYQVNNDKDTVPAYPHEEGDVWVHDKAPSMREDARFLWNYEEIVWTDDTVTYTAPAVIGAMGETGATTPVLSVSHGAVSRNSLGAFDPATVIVSVRRGMEEEELWISAFGIRVNEDGTEDAFYLGNSGAAVSGWNVELKGWSVAIDEDNISSVVFRAYLEFVNDYNTPAVAEHGIAFVQQGEVGEAGPMPRNRGQYNGSEEYFYNDEYRDYVWDSNGFVWIRQGRGVTEGTETQGAIKGIQPSTEGNTEYWEVADRRSLTAIDTALIDEANIAGFMYKDGMMVSQERDENVTKENPLGSKIVINGNTGYLKCEDADVTGIITAGVMSYKILYGTDNDADYDLTGYGMGVGVGRFLLPEVSDGECLEIRMLDIEGSRSTSTMRIATVDGSYIYVKGKDGYMYVTTETELSQNNLYTVIAIKDDWNQGRMAWMISEGIGGSTSGDLSLFVDEALDAESGNPVQNKVIVEELKKYVTLAGDGVQNITGPKNFTGGIQVNGNPIVYNSSKKYWKLDGDLLVTGGVTAYGDDSSFTPSTIMDAIRVDDSTISKANGYLEVVGGTGDGLDEGALYDYLVSNKYLKQPEADERYATPSDLDDRIDSLVNGAPAAYDTLKEIADVLAGNVDSIDDILKAIEKKADKATTLAGYGITDAKISNGVITLGGNSITPLTQASGDARYLLQSAYTASDILAKLKTVDGSGSGLDADTLDGVQLFNVLPAYIYSAESGILVTTDIAVGADKMCEVYITGNSYANETSVSHINVLSLVQFYNYNSGDSIIGAKARHYGENLGDINVFNYGGYVCIWFSPTRTYQTFRVSVHDNYSTRNRVSSITNTAMPSSGVTRLVTITPSLGAPSADKLNNTRTIWGQTFDGTGNVSGALSGATTISASGKVSAGSLSVSGTSSFTGLTTHSGGLSGTTGTFSNSVTIDGIKLSKSQDSVLYLDGNLVVKGGVTMYGDNTVTASTIMDAIRVDGSTISKANGYLEVIGGTGGGLDEGALYDYLVSNKYLTQTTADARYVASVGTSGNTLTWTKDGVSNSITVPYATQSAWSGYLNSKGQITDLNTPSTYSDSGARMVYNSYIRTASNQPSVVNNANVLLTLYKGQHTSSGSQYFSQLSFPDSDAIYFRRSVNGVYYDWKKVAFTDSNITGNAATATKATQDGDGNVIKSTYLKLAGGTMTGTVYSQSVIPSSHNTYSLGGSSTRWAGIYSYLANSGAFGYSTVYQKAISSTGWYRFATSTMSNGLGGNYLFSINRSYTYTNNESYQVAVSVSWNGTVSFTQISGDYNAQVITKIRCAYTNSGEMYFDFYYNTTSQNTVYVSGVGHMTMQAPVSTAASHGMTGDVEFSFGKGCIAAEGFTGDLDGNAASATKATQDSDGNVIKDTYLKSASYTASDILTKMKTVDGAGSGLDADTVDGLQASSFARYYGGASVDENLIGVGYDNSSNGSVELPMAGGFVSATQGSYGMQLLGNASGGHLYFRGVYNKAFSEWKQIAFTDSDITGNAATATTASKLSTVSKTAWGQTYWTSGGVPTTISGNMSNVGNITFNSNAVTVGAWGTGIQTIHANIVSSGGDNRNLWLIGTSYNASYGIVFARNTTGTGTGEIARMNSTSFYPYTSGGLAIGTSSNRWGGIYSTTGNFSGKVTAQGGMEGSYWKINDTSSNPYLMLTQGSTWYVQGYDGYLYMGAGSAKSVRVDSTGNLFTPGGITMYSDIRKKTKISDVELTLDQVADAPLIEHYYNADEKKETHVGSIAQYWAGMNDWFCKKDNEGFYTMEIQNAALASSISVARELRRFESETDRRIRLLEEENRQLRKEIQELKTI